jgi:predicted small secreted protein
LPDKVVRATTQTIRSREKEGKMNTRKLVFVVLLLSLVLAACGGGGDGGGKPVDVVKNVVKAMEKLDAEKAREYMCAAHKDAIPDIEEEFAEFEEFGADIDEVMEAFKIEMSDMKYEETSKDDDKAVVHVTGKMAFDIDVDKLKPIFKTAFEEILGMEVTDDMLDEMMAEFTADMGEETSLDGDVNLIKEDGDWVVCDELEFLNE